MPTPTVSDCIRAIKNHSGFICVDALVAEDVMPVAIVKVWLIKDLQNKLAWNAPSPFTFDDVQEGILYLHPRNL